MLRLLILTSAAMVAFAANSVLTRLALAPDPPLIDAASFGSLRVVSAAVLLWLILAARRGARGDAPPFSRRFAMAVALFVYIVGFSFAYISLGSGTGALVLFGMVQLTMFAVALWGGERMTALGWVGLAAAFGGLVLLVAPGAAAPDPAGAALMAAAGVGWGVYSLLGRGVADPLGATAWNFLLCAPLTLAVSAIFAASASITPAGAALAVASGAAASGLGYAIWYAALPDLGASRAATVQLVVPVLAAAGGAVLLSEPVNARMAAASVATLGGVALVLAQRRASA